MGKKEKDRRKRGAKKSGEREEGDIGERKRIRTNRRKGRERENKVKKKNMQSFEFC